MSTLLPPFWLIRVAVAAVWLYEGLWCKLLRGQPHEFEVVEAVPYFGPRVGALFLRALGVVEVAIAVWTLSAIAPIMCAVAQTLLLVTLELPTAFCGRATSSTIQPAWWSRTSPSSCWCGCAPVCLATHEREGTPMSATVAETVWERGRFDARGGPSKVLFGRMYEDRLDRARRVPSRGTRTSASRPLAAPRWRSRRGTRSLPSTSIPSSSRTRERRFDGRPRCSRHRGARHGHRAFLGAAWRAGGRRGCELSSTLTIRPRKPRTGDSTSTPARFRVALDGLVLADCAARGLRFADSSTFCHLALAPSCARAWSAALPGTPIVRTPTRARCSWASGANTPTPPEANDIRLVHADAAAFLEREPAGASTDLRYRTSWMEPTQPTNGD